MSDMINHPSHYTAHPSGIECIQITEHFNFCLGNAIKYLFRRNLKHSKPVLDTKKALWYIDREIERRSINAGMESVSGRPEVRSVDSWRSKKYFDEKDAGTCSNKKSLHDPIIQPPGGEANPSVHSPNGFSYVEGGMPSGDGSFTLEWGPIRQSAGESKTRKSYTEYAEENRTCDGLQRAQKSSGEVVVEPDSGDTPEPEITCRTSESVRGSPRHDRKSREREELESNIQRLIESESMGISDAFDCIYMAHLKGDAIEDLKKARYYIDREIARLEG